MANDFQTKELALTTVFQQLVNSDTLGRKRFTLFSFQIKMERTAQMFT